MLREASLLEWETEFGLGGKKTQASGGIVPSNYFLVEGDKFHYTIQGQSQFEKLRNVKCKKDLWS